jgi:ribosome modulation factor
MAQRLKRGNGSESTVGIVPPEVVLDARREITSSKTALETAQTNHRNTCKRWQNQGVNTKALIEVIQLRRKEPEVVVSHFKDVFRYGRIEKAEFAMQPDLFVVRDAEVTGKARAQHEEFEAEEAGYVAGRRGFGQDSAPGVQGEKQNALWLKGWKRGQKHIANQMGKNAKVATRAPRKTPATGTTTANPGRRRGRPAAAPPPAESADPTLPLH